MEDRLSFETKPCLTSILKITEGKKMVESGCVCRRSWLLLDLCKVDVLSLEDKHENPVFSGLSQADMLERCLTGATQN